MGMFDFKTIAVRRAARVAGVFMLATLAAGSPLRAQGIEPEVDKILKFMSAYLGATKAFSFNADIDFEVVARSGQKLQLSSFARLVMQRPSNLYVRRQGMFANSETIFDGKTLTLYVKNEKLNVYSQTEVAGTIDEAIRAYEFETGLPAPGADLLFADPYAILASGVESGFYVGTAYVNGVECHHLAFREAEVDWQLWVRADDAPLPMKYVITTKWHTAAPQYEIRLRDWKRSPQIRADQFTFTVPKGASRLDTLLVDEIGEFTVRGGQ